MVSNTEDEFFSSDSYNKAMKAFIVLSTEELLDPLEKYKNKDYFWYDCFYNSYHGLYSVISAAGLPFNLINDGIVQRRFQAFHSSERILSLKKPLPGEEIIQLSQEDIDRRSYDKANQKMAEFFKSEEGVDFLRKALVSDINHRLNSPDIRVASEELLIQTLISAWSVFESFSRNIIISFVNKNPNLATPILASPDLKEFFGKQTVAINVISDHGYDLSQSMGNIIFSNRRLDGLGVIRSVMKSIFSSPILQSALGEDIWIVNQRRHLFVHNRGIVDSDYIKNTSDKLLVGDKLVLNAYDVQKSLFAVRDAIQAICDCAVSFETDPAASA